MVYKINPITGKIDLVSVNTTITTGGALNFTELLDVPNSYSGESGSSLKVNGAEDALEFYTPEIVSLTGGTGITTSGTYPDFTVSNTILTHSQLLSLTGSDDHTQYARLLGRGTGQVLYGSTGSSGNLTLSGNPIDADKGDVVINAANLFPAGDSSTNLGGTANAYSNIYLSGYLRMRNPGSTSSAWNKIIADTQSTETTYVWPNAYPTINGQSLTSDTGGVMSWGSSFPAGAMVMYGSSSAPSGWLNCDGGSYATASYFNLYSAIGYTFGTGSGSSFLVPDWQLKFPKGYKSGVNSVGDTGGSIDYTPAGGIDAHTYGNQSLFGSAPNFVIGPNIHTFTGTPAVIQPPFLIINFIIKY